LELGQLRRNTPAKKKQPGMDGDAGDKSNEIKARPQQKGYSSASVFFKGGEV
jgi:hypothetical protein